MQKISNTLSSSFPLSKEVDESVNSLAASSREVGLFLSLTGERIIAGDNTFSTREGWEGAGRVAHFFMRL